MNFIIPLQEAKRVAQQNALSGYAGTMDGTGDFKALAQRRQSIGIGSMFADILQEDEEEDAEEIRGHEKYQWKYSEYQEAIERENQLLNGDDRASSIMSGELSIQAWWQLHRQGARGTFFLCKIVVCSQFTPDISDRRTKGQYVVQSG